jgi:hypothetical protein
MLQRPSSSTTSGMMHGAATRGQPVFAGMAFACPRLQNSEGYAWVERDVLNQLSMNVPLFSGAHCAMSNNVSLLPATLLSDT